MDQRIINGSTLFGTALALFGLSQLFSAMNWQYYIMISGFVFFLIESIIAFFERKN